MARSVSFCYLRNVAYQHRLWPAGGTASVLGGPPRDNDAFWRAVAHVAEQPARHLGLTVRERPEFVRMTHESASGWCLAAPDELIGEFGLTVRADASPLSLSSGRRLALAAAFARPSRLFLLDEPEQSLDANFKKQLAALLRDDYAGRDGAVVAVTARPELRARVRREAVAPCRRVGRGRAGGRLPSPQGGLK